MYILHLALGGCLTAPDVNYGVTEDTGGHIGYILGAANAQAMQAGVSQVDIVTRAFDDVHLGAIHAVTAQPVAPNLTIRRLTTDTTHYLAKEALAAEVPALTQQFVSLLRSMAQRPDVIHAHFADAAQMAQAAKTAFGIPFVYTPHSLGVDKQACSGHAADPALHTRITLERAALEQADAIIVSSRDEAERQIRQYGLHLNHKVHRIWPGTSMAPAADQTCASALACLEGTLADPAKPLILAIARPVRRKNLTALAEVFAATPALHMHANLVILAGQHDAVGREGQEVIAALKSIAARPAMKGRFAIPARHSPTDVAEFYTLAARSNGLLVNPALHEPFGLTLLEAASFGVPVVSTRHGGPQDILTHLRNGLSVEPTDNAEIASALQRMLGDPLLWDAASTTGVNRVATLSWDRWADEVAVVYQGLATPRNRSDHRLLVCDIDHTLTGCRAGARAFSEWSKSRTIGFAIATGRNVDDARRVLHAWDLPQPDTYITSVGTEIHHPNREGAPELCQKYADWLDQFWNRARVLSVLEATTIPLQPAPEQRRWKLCCFGTARNAETIERALDDAKVPAKVIASHGQFIDIVPVNGGKGNAVAFLAGRMGIRPRDCITAGDSGNDLDMLRVGGLNVLVGNALPETWKIAHLPNVFKATRPHAGGVLEGLAKAGLSMPLALTAVPYVQLDAAE